MLNKRIIFLLTAAFILNGCSTMVWYDSVNGPSHTMEYSEEKDEMVAFGRTKASSKAMPANELVMLGNRYIFVITKVYGTRNAKGEEQPRLDEILNIKLSRAFNVHEDLGMYKVPDFNAKNGGTLPVTYNAKDGEFVSDFCLNYPVNTALSASERAREDQKLAALKFEKHPNGSRFICMYVAGKVYAKPQNMNYQYRFETAIPIKLYVSRPVYDNAGRGAKMATLPLAVAADIVTFPLQLLGLGLLSGADWH